ncbi:MAG: GTPase HflX [Candidatus Omnitrophica bacterium]|nr:GTPase HflX [Candidatus Omnitrophota bacterium]
MENVEEKRENVLLVVIEFKAQKKEWPMKEILNEMTELVVACGGEVVDSILCRDQRPTASHLIGEGKIKEIAQSVGLNDVDTVIFSQDLKGSQQRNIENVLKVKTIDRTQLILDIFAKRARTSEAKAQVELAQLEYLLPRLVGKGVELSRLGGGIGTLGPGETKLEMDRRRISQRIDKLKKNLKDITANHSLRRKKRQKRHIPTLSLVGYTNAGKSTLLNALTEAGQETKDGLFTTLTSLTRQFVLPNQQKIVLSDTVGFMRALPHHLIESFKTTLDEVRESDVLIHVVDVSHSQFRFLFDSVIKVLAELNVLEKPIINVFNKIDRIDDKVWLNDLRNNYQHAVCVSAQSGDNLNDLLETIICLIDSYRKEIIVDVPIDRMDLINLAHEEGEVLSVKYYSDKINLRANIPQHLVGRFYRC